jgi:hypothetical protein
MTVPPTISSRIGWAVGAIFAAAYICVFVWYSPLLLQDYPNHLARAVVIDDLLFHGGSQFGNVFEYHFLAIPYILSDLPLVAGIELFCDRYGGAIWNGLILLSLPSALIFYMRVTRIARDAQILVFTLSMYLATNWFYMMGFLAFALAIAAIVFCFALVEILRQRWSNAVFCAYVVVLVLAYLVHLTTLIFLTAAIVVSAGTRLWLRTTSIKTEALILLPIGALLAWHFGVVVRYRSSGDLTEEGYFWGTVFRKIQRAGWPFIRYSPILDGALLLAFIACVALAIRRNLSRGTLTQPRVLEKLALAATFLAIYVVLPEGYPGAFYVDVRALPLVTFFLLMACLELPGKFPANRSLDSSFALSLAALLVAGNLAYLTLHLSRYNAWLNEYRTVVAAIPRGAYVLPIYTGAEEGTLRPSLHAASFVVADRGAIIPYLFSGDRGSPMKYFRYLHRRYSPYIRWYERPASFRVDWPSVACSYDFLLAMKPFDPRQISVSTTTVLENDSAALLAVAKQACHS